MKKKGREHTQEKRMEGEREEREREKCLVIGKSRQAATT